ncbi:MAG: M61 family metallopeptidase [Gemmatimonadota bacterium]|nr:M61 family metallopeptidase [Gemmatimonadota bacterium]
MIPPRISGLLRAAAAVALTLPRGANAQAPVEQPIAYVLSVAAPARHMAHVRVEIPTDGHETLDLLLPAWTPGYYAAENHAAGVDSVTARGAGGAALPVRRTGANHWEVETRGAPVVTLSYRIRADGRGPTGDYVGDSAMVLNGRATWLTPAGYAQRDVRVSLALPPGWRSFTPLDTASDRANDHYRASGYAELSDAPIVAGPGETVEFDVAGTTHLLADVAAPAGFSHEQAGRSLLRLVVEVQRFWGFLPYQRYEFLNVFGPGAGGPGHLNATVLAGRADLLDAPGRLEAWLGDAARGYFRAFDGTRLHPAEYAVMDYDTRPATPSLWVSDGLGAYYAQLLQERAGLLRQQDFLDALSALIARAQGDPMRRSQTLTAASLDAGTPLKPRERRLDWTARGAVVGFLLDAHLRAATNGAKSLDDVMRLAYQRFSGTAGYSDAQFRALVSEVAGSDQTAWLAQALDSADELNYKEMLDWYGLRFDGGWNLAVVEPPPKAAAAARDTAATGIPTPAQQQQHLTALLKPDAGPATGPAAPPSGG